MRSSKRSTTATSATAKELIHHSDRGVQYMSIRYKERLAEAGIEPSVGSVGDSYDNALAETIIGLFKTEVIRQRGLARDRGRRTGDARVGRLVQSSTATRADRRHAAGREGRRVLSATESAMVA